MLKFFAKMAGSKSINFLPNGKAIGLPFCKNLAASNSIDFRQKVRL